MPASIAHFVTFMETGNDLKNSHGSLVTAEPITTQQLKEPNATLGKGITDKGISQYCFLGSIFPDLPYYNEKSEYAADLFHYNGSGSFAIKLIDYAKGKGSDDPAGQRLMAFILGFVSHIACDTVCHPYINTIAGAYWNQGVPYIDKIDLPMLPISRGKVSMHMMTETHQDSWLANRYFGLKNLSSEGISRSWSGFLEDLSLGVLIAKRKKETNELFKDICSCFEEVYGKSLNLDHLWTAGNRFFEALDGSYDRALFPFPDYPTMDLVNYKHGMNKYFFYLEKGFDLSKMLGNKAIAYYNGGNAEKDDAKKYIKNWNLDMGYFIRVKKTDDKKSIVVRFEHSWCHNYGLDP